MRILETLKDDHRKIIMLIHEIVDTSERPSPDVIEDYFINLRKVLLLHLQCEEKEVYRYLATQPAAIGEIAKARQDHGEIDYLLSELTNIVPGQSAWVDTAYEIKSRIESHIDYEEHVLFPLFQELQDDFPESLAGSVSRSNRPVALD